MCVCNDRSDLTSSDEYAFGGEQRKTGVSFVSECAWSSIQKMVVLACNHLNVLYNVVLKVSHSPSLAQLEERGIVIGKHTLNSRGLWFDPGRRDFPFWFFFHIFTSFYESLGRPCPACE